MRLKLDQESEAFLASLLEQMRRALVVGAGGDVQREWSLGSRLSEILAARAHASLADRLGLALAEHHDTWIEVSVGGVPHAGYEAAFLRAELWVGLTESIHSVIDVPAVRDDVMGRENVGDHSLPALIYLDEQEEATERDT